MKAGKKHAVALGGFVAVLLFVGCAKLFELADPPRDHAVVQDRVLEAVGSPTYTLREIDGQPIQRERFQFGVDMMPGAVVSPGEHLFKVDELRRLPHAMPREVTFTATVEGRKRYPISTRQGLPVLVESGKPDHSKDAIAHSRLIIHESEVYEVYYSRGPEEAKTALLELVTFYHSHIDGPKSEALALRGEALALARMEFIDAFLEHRDPKLASAAEVFRRAAPRIPEEKSEAALIALVEKGDAGVVVWIPSKTNQSPD
jgi:hypothetical protein